MLSFFDTVELLTSAVLFRAKISHTSMWPKHFAMVDMQTTKTLNLSDLIQDDRNANKGTTRGAKAIEESLKRYGAGRSILIDKNGKIIGGNKTAENAIRAGFTRVLVVPNDGKTLVAVQRTDLDLNEDAEAKALAIADNRTSELSLDWNPEVLQNLVVADDLDLSPFFSTEELATILGEAPDFQPVDDQMRLDERAKVKCPKCSHEFVP